MWGMRRSQPLRPDTIRLSDDNPSGLKRRIVVLEDVLSCAFL